MPVASPAVPSVAELVVGDPRRAPFGRALAATLVSAGVFEIFAWTTKEIRGLYVRAPWQNDPYDAVVSFTLFFVPLAATLLVVRALPCRRDGPLPVARLVAILRASWVVLAAVLVTLAVDWISVFRRADESTWSTTTNALIAALAIATLVAIPAATLVQRAGMALRGSHAPAAGPDAMADALALARDWSVRLGPLARPATALLTPLEARIAPAVRRQPLTAAALASLAFGAALGVAAAREDGLAPVLALVLAVAACGMFAFLAAAGSYLGLVHAERPLVGRRRRVADGMVLAAGAVPIVVAFRSSLWWAVGATDTTAVPGDLGALVLGAAGVTLALVVVAETLAGVHSPRASQESPR